MTTIPLKSVQINDENRWRKEFDEAAINELAESILNVGLLHAPVVQNDGRTLVAGERRWRAISQLASLGKMIRYNGHSVKLGHVPIIRMDDLSERAYKEAEADENIKRVDLPWQIKSYAISELHKLREGQASERGEKHTKTDTAREIAPDPEDPKIVAREYREVREDLLVAAYLDDEEVRKAKTREDGVKLVKKKLKAAHRRALAREFDLSKMDTPHIALHGDLLDLLKTLPAHEFDCIIADPPYGVSADKFKNQAAVQHSYSDSEEYANEITSCIAREGLRVTKFKAHAYIFCDIIRFSAIKRIFEAYEWYVWRTPLIWSKGANVGIAPRPDHGPRRTYEAIVYAIKNDRIVNGVWPDVVLEAHDKSVQFGAHKPPNLYANLIKRSCSPGDAVLDPCCGTGPVFLAAEECKVVATGIEVDEEAFGYCVARLRNMKGEEE